MERNWDYITLPWPEWKIVRLLGTGTFGSVFEIHREMNGHISRAAVKIITIPSDESKLYSLRAEGMGDQEIDRYLQRSAEKLQNEILMMEELQTANNIVSIHDSVIYKRRDQEGYQLFIRMELLSNLDLYCYGKNENKPMTVADVIKLGCDICNALSACEKKNIIHRDIKPSNIFVSEYGDFKLGDFGVSRQKEHTQSEMSLQGTVNYMAPEVYRGEHNYDSTVDIYSLGLVLYKMLNRGRVPFVRQTGPVPSAEENTNAQQMRLRGKQSFPDPLLGGKQLAAILRKACSNKAKDRYRNAEEMREALLKCKYSMPKAELEQEIVQRRDDSRTDRSNKRAQGSSRTDRSNRREQVGCRTDGSNRREQGGSRTDGNNRRVQGSSRTDGSDKREQINGRESYRNNRGYEDWQETPGSVRDIDEDDEVTTPMQPFEWEEMQAPQKSKRSMKKYAVILAAIIGVGGIAGITGGAKYFYEKGKREAVTETEVEVAAEVTPVPTVTPMPEPTSTPVPTATPIPTNTPTPVPTATPIPTNTPTPEPTATPTPTNTPIPQGVPLDEAHFPDEVFRKAVKEFDKDGDEQLSNGEIEEITEIDVSLSNVKSLQGVRYLTALKKLQCDYNELSSLDVSQNTELQYLDCGENELSSLDVSQNTELQYLSCHNNQLSNLDVSQNTELQYLECDGNWLSSLDVRKNTELQEFSCSENYLSSLDVSQNAKLQDLNCWDNQLSSLDVSQNAQLQILQCDYNQLSSLDISQNKKLKDLTYDENTVTLIQ